MELEEAKELCIRIVDNKRFKISDTIDNRDKVAIETVLKELESNKHIKTEQIIENLLLNDGILLLQKLEQCKIFLSGKEQLSEEGIIYFTTEEKIIKERLQNIIGGGKRSRSK